jgi:signal transduction histidine kinase
VVLQNLLGNAWKYAGRRAERQIEFGVTTREGQTVYFVRDNGIGFDPAEGGRMFEAFRRLPNALDFAGTGIGLVTVKRIINRHGGQIWCEGKLDQGATFYFSLPRGGGGGSGDKQNSRRELGPGHGASISPRPPGEGQG